MRRLLPGILLAVFCCASSAHEDTPLRLEPDGSLPQVPAQFGNTTLRIDLKAKPSPAVEFTVGDHSTSLPACLTQFIRSKSMSDVSIAGSWYHDEKAFKLPYYVSVEFSDPGQKDPSMRNGYTFLFSLHNASPVWAYKTSTAWHITGKSAHLTDVSLSCS